MLKVEDIKFPISFKSIGVGRIIFDDINAKGFNMDNEKTNTCGLSFYVRLHNRTNPNNSRNKDYYSPELEAQVVAERKAAREKSFNDLFHQPLPGQIYQSPGVFFVSGVTKGAIEAMPVNSTLTGYFDDEGNHVELKFKPRHIEVHEDVITLLMHYGAGSKGRVAGEVNLPIGTIVTWENTRVKIGVF